MARLIVFIILSCLLLLHVSQGVVAGKTAIPAKRVTKVQLGSNKQRTGAWKAGEVSGNRTALWLQQRSLASAIGTDVISNVQIPLHVNVLSIGLDGSGHLGQSLPGGLLEHWSEQLEQSMEHVQVDQFEHIHGKQQGQHDYSAGVEYAISSEMITTAPSVSSAFNRVQHSVHRITEPESLNDDEPTMDGFGHYSKMLSAHAQVDGDLVADMIADLAISLSVPKGYSFGVLNIKRDWLIRSFKSHKLFNAAMEKSLSSAKGTKHDAYGSKSYPPFYGYRGGLSNQEQNHITHGSDIPTWREAVVQAIRAESKSVEHVYKSDLIEIDNELRSRASGAYYKRFPPAWEPTPARYRINDRAQSAVSDTALRKEALKNAALSDAEEAKMAARSNVVPPTIDTPAVFHKAEMNTVSSAKAARATLSGAVKVQYDTSSIDPKSNEWANEMLGLFHYDHVYPGKSVPGLVRFMKKTSPFALYQASTSPFIQETCLSDTWVGSERAGFLDLTAGPFKWGPVVGGVNMRTYYTHPNVDDQAKMSVTEDPDQYSRGGMMYYDYVKGENRMSQFTDKQATDGDVVKSSGSVGGGGSQVLLTGDRKYNANDIAVERKDVDLVDAHNPADARIEREGFVDIDKLHVENAEEWGIRKKKKKTNKRKGSGREQHSFSEHHAMDSADTGLLLSFSVDSTSTGRTVLAVSATAADDDDEYDNYFTKEELAALKKHKEGSSKSKSSKSHVKDEDMPLLGVSDTEKNKESLDWVDKLFEDEVLAQSLGTLTKESLKKSVERNAAFDSAVEQADLDGHHTSTDNFKGIGSASAIVEDADTSTGEVEEVQKGSDLSEDQWQDLQSQFTSMTNNEGEMEDLLLDEAAMRKDLDAEKIQDKASNLSEEGKPVSMEEFEKSPIPSFEETGGVEVKQGLYTSEQIDAEIAMLENLLQSEACILKALDCTDYVAELDDLKKTRESMLKKTSSKSELEAAEAAEHVVDEQTQEEEDAEEKVDKSNNDAIKAKAKQQQSSEDNTSGDESGLQGVEEQTEGTDLWEDDAQDSAEENRLAEIEADIKRQQRKKKKRKAIRRKRLLKTAPRGSRATAAQWRGEVNMLDHFTAHLMQSIRGYVRNVVAPPVADLRAVKLYHRKVQFSVYVVRNHNNYNPLENEMYHKFRLAMEQARVKGQEFSFHLNELHIGSDPALAMAYEGALRTAIIPTMLFDGHTSAIKRMYLDGNVLQTELQSRLLLRSNPLPKSTREIPIFLFSLSSELPVFIDKHYQARALRDMVIAVQSNYHLWESPLTCNGRPVNSNLRNPLKPLIQSTLLALGGLLPSHMSFDTVHRKPSQSWQWSTGDHALSNMFSSEEGITLSKHSVDTLHRNYIIHAIKTSTSILNRAVERLSFIKPTEANMQILNVLYTKKHRDGKGKHVVAWEGSKIYKLLRKAHRSVRYRIHKMRKLISRLDYAVAVRHIRDLVGTAYQFHSLADVFAKHAKNNDCLADKSQSVPALVTMAEATSNSASVSNTSTASDIKISRSSVKFTKSSKKVLHRSTISAITAYFWIAGGIIILAALMFRCANAKGARTR